MTTGVDPFPQPLRRMRNGVGTGNTALGKAQRQRLRLQPVFKIGSYIGHVVTNRRAHAYYAKVAL